METLEARRHEVRIGVVFTALAALLTAFTLEVIADGERSPWWLVIAILIEAGIGIGLLRGSRVLRWLAAIQLVIAGGGAVLSTTFEIAELRPGTSAFDLGNALASTTLFVWVCAVGTLGLLAPRRRTTGITLRLVGACLAMVALSHLYLATAVGSFIQLWPFRGASINLRLTGISVWGFPGWPLWHAVLFVTSLVLAFAPRRIQRHACSVLFVLLVLAALLTLVSLLAGGIPGAASVLMLLVWSVLLFPLYLVWWLTDNAS